MPHARAREQLSCRFPREHTHDGTQRFIGVPIDRNVFAFALRPFAYIRLPRSV
jgi:hypothetical protein